MLRSVFSLTALAAAALLLGPSLAPAQTRSTGGSGLGMSSSIGGSSIGGGGLGGSSLGGSSIGGGGLSGGGLSGGSSLLGSTANSFLGGSTTGSTTSQGFLGGSTTGGTGGGGRGGSTTPGSTSFLGANYTNPYAMGQPNSTSPTKFGTALYNVTPTVATLPGQTTGRGTATINQNQTNTNGLGVGFAGKRPTNYTIGSISVGGLEQRSVNALPPPAAAARPDIQAALAQTPNFQGVNVVMDGGTVVLRGRISDERDRRVAEMVARMAPGVREVRNEIVVSASP
jgi:hypothetical protein